MTTIITVTTIIMIIMIIMIITMIMIITVIKVIKVITWFSGVARDGKMIRPKAGTRKASAVFTLNGDYENDGDDAEDDDMIMMIVNNMMSSKPAATFCMASLSRTEEATTLSEMIPARREKTAWARWGVAQM